MVSNNIEKVISIYCNEELEEFKQSSITQDIIQLAKQKGYFVKIEFGTKDNDINNFYISIAIVDDSDEIVVIEDDGHLCYSTTIVTIDSKNRIILSSWSERDFIETLEWMKNSLI